MCSWYFVTARSRDPDPLVVQCLADCEVAEGLLGGFGVYHFTHVKLHHGCGITWTRINIDLSRKKRAKFPRAVGREHVFSRRGARYGRRV